MGKVDKSIRLRDKENWNVWKFSMLIMLKSKKFKAYVDGTTLEPTEFNLDGSKKNVTRL